MPGVRRKTRLVHKKGKTRSACISTPHAALRRRGAHACAIAVHPVRVRVARGNAGRTWSLGVMSAILNRWCGFWQRALASCAIKLFMKASASCSLLRTFFLPFLDRSFATTSSMHLSCSEQARERFGEPTQELYTSVGGVARAALP